MLGVAAAITRSNSLRGGFLFEVLEPALVTARVAAAGGKSLSRTKRAEHKYRQRQGPFSHRSVRLLWRGDHSARVQVAVMAETRQFFERTLCRLLSARRELQRDGDLLFRQVSGSIHELAVY